MENSHSKSYADAGVDVTAGYEAVRRIKPMVESTYTRGVMGTLGGFGGMFAPDMAGMKKPILVSGTDGVGTKLRLAFLMNRHDTVGIDCVAMCVNDIICAGAAPMFFLDYISCGKNNPSQIADIVAGIAEGCKQAECALVGGETAEMPGFYPVGEYDLAGFSVGIVDEEKIIDGIAEGCKQAECALVGGETAEMPGFYPVGEYDLAGFSVGIVDEEKIIDSKNLSVGDTLIGLASSGVHSNGFSLVRKVFDVENANLDTPMDELLGKSLGEALLTPTKIYVRALKKLINSSVDIHAISHITGGGFYENVPRMMKEGLTATINLETFAVPPIFKLIQKAGNIPERDMYNTFNMGIGMVLAVPSAQALQAMSLLEEIGETAYTIGTVTAGDSSVELVG